MAHADRPATARADAPAPPRLSVVVTTYNRAALLEGAVRGILAQEGAPPFELIVVDNNSRDRTREVVEALIPASAGRLRYLFEGRQGVSHGRNAGAAAARGEILAFTDDDVRPAPHWLAALARAFDAHPDVDYVGGRVRPMWPEPPPHWVTDHAHSSPLALIDYGDAPLPVTRDAFRCFVTANLAVRRRAFDAVGGFDPRHQHEPGAVTAIEDHELQVRLLRAGARGRYEPSAEMHAEVQADRLQAAYHRRWWYDSGRSRARLSRPGALFDGGCGYVELPPHARTLFGVPLFLYREVMTHAARAVRDRLRRREVQALSAEFLARRTAGFISYLAAERLRSRASTSPTPTTSPAASPSVDLDSHAHG